MIKKESEKLYFFLKEEIKAFSLSSQQSKRAFRCAFSVILAALTSFIVHADLPFWACISALVVTERSTGELLWKCFQRALATLAGAVAGLVTAILFSDYTLLFCLIIFVVATFGMYMMSIHKRMRYVWLLGWITYAMVMLMGLDYPSTEHFTEIAFNRSFEVIIGIVASFFSALFIFPESTFLEGKKGIIQIYRQLALCSSVFIESDPEVSEKNGIFEKCSTNDEKLEKLQSDMTLLFSRIEPIKKEQKLFKRKHVDLESWLHCAKYVSMALFSGSLPNKLPEYHLDTIAKIQSDFATVCESIARFIEGVSLQHEVIQQVTRIKKAIKKEILHYSHSKKKYDCLLFVCLLKFEKIYESILKTLDTENIKKEKHHTFSVHHRKLKHDLFIVKFSLTYAIALLFVPFIWLFFKFGGFSQVAISIAASVSFSGKDTRYKGFQRLAGCFTGCLIALFFLRLGLDNLAVYLVVLFIFCFSQLYFRMGKSEVSYFGIQSTVVLVTGCVAGLSPAVTVVPSIERLAGIICGVLSLMVVQRIFWKVSEYNTIRHLFKQIKQSLFVLTKEAEKTSLMTTYHPELVSLEEDFAAIENFSSTNRLLSLFARQLLEAHRKLYISFVGINLLKNSLFANSTIYARIVSLLKDVLSNAYVSMGQVDKAEKSLVEARAKIHEVYSEKESDMRGFLTLIQLEDLINDIQLCIDCYRKNVSYGLKYQNKTFVKEMHPH